MRLSRGNHIETAFSSDNLMIPLEVNNRGTVMWPAAVRRAVGEWVRIRTASFLEALVRTTQCFTSAGQPTRQSDLTFQFGHQNLGISSPSRKSAVFVMIIDLGSSFCAASLHPHVSRALPTHHTREPAFRVTIIPIAYVIRIGRRRRIWPREKRWLNRVTVAPTEEVNGIDWIISHKAKKVHSTVFLDWIPI